jgi:hypothetical protein
MQLVVAARRGAYALLVLAGLHAPAFTAPTLEPASSGVALESESQAPWRQYLIHRNSGAPDPRFGENGRVLIDGMTPRSVAGDLRGRYIVAGQTSDARPEPVLRRYLSNGHIDPSWGDQGSTTGAPVAGSATAIAASPLGDGRTLVLGEIERVNPQAALWVVGSDGKFEARWLLLNEAPSSRALSLVRVGADTAMLGLLVSRDTEVLLEGYLFVAARDGDALPERIAKQKLPKGWSRSPRLEHRDKGWFWVDPEQPKPTFVRAAGTDEADAAFWTWQSGPGAPLEEPPQALPHSPARESGGAAFNPFVERRAVDTPASAKPAFDDDGVDLTLFAFATLVAGLLFVWLLRRSSGGA